MNESTNTTHIHIKYPYYNKETGICQCFLKEKNNSV